MKEEEIKREHEREKETNRQTGEREKERERGGVKDHMRDDSLMHPIQCTCIRVIEWKETKEPSRTLVTNTMSRGSLNDQVTNRMQKGG